jgi:hypothetical protein
MGEVSCLMRTAMFTTESGPRTRRTDKALTSTRTGHATLANGSKTSRKEGALRHGLMGLDMKECTKMARKMVKEHCILQMEASTLVPL